ncbi:type II toxin-antitoxin system RelE/ParE family toxin [Mucilaginibacter sp. HD30]
MYKTVMLPVAKHDIKDAASWYNSKQKNLGKRFIAEIQRKVNFIQKFPDGTAIRYDEIKTAVIDTFPFMVHYSVDNVKKLIVILAVLHTSRNPDIWKEER